MKGFASDLQAFQAELMGGAVASCPGAGKARRNSQRSRIGGNLFNL